MLGTIFRRVREPKKIRGAGGFLSRAGKCTGICLLPVRVSAHASAIIGSFVTLMGKDYKGVGYLTGRRLSFHSDLPTNAVRVDDDSRTPSSDTKGKRGMTNIGAIIGREVLDSRGNP